MAVEQASEFGGFGAVSCLPVGVDRGVPRLVGGAVVAWRIGSSIGVPIEAPESRAAGW